MKCPHCNGKLLQKSGSSTKVRITGTLEVSDDGLCKSQCYWCKKPVDIPLPLLKSAPADEERFLLQEPKTP